MIKIQFDQPLPHKYRDFLIHSFRDIGFKYDRIFQSGDYAVFKFFGKMPCLGKTQTISIIYENPDLEQTFKQIQNDYLEITFFIERN